MLLLAASLAAIALVLAGCKSDDERREDIVRCGGFSVALLMSNAPTAAVEAAFARQGLTAQDTLPLSGAAQTYASAMDPAKAARLSQEGAISARNFLNKKDADGLASYLKDCATTYKELAR